MQTQTLPTLKQALTAYQYGRIVNELFNKDTEYYVVESYDNGQFKQLQFDEWAIHYSNAVYLMREYSGNMLEIHHPSYTSHIVYIVTSNVDIANDILNRLDDYPLLDEDKHTELLHDDMWEYLNRQLYELLELDETYVSNYLSAHNIDRASVLSSKHIETMKQYLQAIEDNRTIADILSAYNDMQKVWSYEHIVPLITLSFDIDVINYDARIANANQTEYMTNDNVVWVVTKNIIVDKYKLIEYAHYHNGNMIMRVWELDYIISYKR